MTISLTRVTAAVLLVGCVVFQADAFAGGLTPAEAQKQLKVPDGLTVSLVVAEPKVSQPLSISFDDRGRMWVLQYLQYPIPNGLKAVKVDRYLRTEYDKIPEPPPKGPKGRDRISIYEDTNGDGRSDSVKHFLSNLNLASGMAIGHGGVFVVQPPYLLFYPDKNQDDVPDADPAVLLTGFGMNDAHAFANSLTWGPDGWLYGAQGSTVTAKIRGIGFQQGIWRYHPLTKEFELFAEGGGNTWGIDFDRHGNLFAGGNTVEPLVHHVQGAYYVKGFGKHGPLHNPHSYGYFRPVKHSGYIGDSLTGGFVLYQGGAFPKRFNNACIAPNTRHSAMRWSTLKDRSSTFTTRAAGDFITSKDIWFRPVDSTVGPDGALYIADWYDYNIAHSSPQNRGKWYQPSRFDGRVWRVAAKTVPQSKSGGRLTGSQLRLDRKTSDALIDLLSHPNDWYARQARRILAERRDKSVIPRLRKLAISADKQRLALQALWSLYVTGGFDDAIAVQTLRSPHEYVRSWTIRLLGDKRTITSSMQSRLVDLARSDRSNVVRSQLACTAKRLAADSSMPIVRELLRRSEDVNDIHIPLLLWWAIEDKAVSNREQVLRLVDSKQAWTVPLIRRFIIERLARRFAAERTDGGLAACAQLLRAAPDDESRMLLVAGMLKALAGQRLDKVPTSLAKQLEILLARKPSDARVVELAMRTGSADADALARRIIGDPKAPLTGRQALIETLGQTRQKSAAPLLLSILQSSQPKPIHAAVLSALAGTDQPEVADAILKVYPRLDAGLKSRAVDTLCGRRDWSRALLKAIAAKRLPAKDVSIEQVRRIQQHKDPAIKKLVSAQFGIVRPATALEKRGRIDAVEIMIRRGKGDKTRGFEVFKKVCASCHKLHGQGKTIGPDLTGAERKDLRKLVTNIVDSSASIRQQYIAHIVATTNGRILTGLLAGSTPTTITLLDAKNNRITLQRSDIEEIRESTVSLMPDQILKPLSNTQIRDLIRYIQSDK